MKPILKYSGGKSKEIKHFVKYIPKEYDRYIEPFLGGGAVYFYLEPENAIINDINDDLMNFYRQLRDNYSEMKLQLGQLHDIYERNQRIYQKRLEAKESRNSNEFVVNDNNDLYYEMRDLFNHPDEKKYLNGVVYYFINKTSFSSMTRYNRKGEYNVPFGRYKHFNVDCITDKHVKLLQKSELYSVDYSEIFNMANTNDFIFLDPPYDCVFNDFGNLNESNHFVNNFGELEHKRLANDFKNLSCKALMVLGKTSLTEELYKEYICDEYFQRYAINIKNRFNTDRTHILVKNY